MTPLNFSGLIVVGPSPMQPQICTADLVDVAYSEASIGASFRCQRGCRTRPFGFELNRVKDAADLMTRLSAVSLHVWGQAAVMRALDQADTDLTTLLAVNPLTHLR